MLSPLAVRLEGQTCIFVLLSKLSIGGGVHARAAVDLALHKRVLRARHIVEQHHLVVIRDFGEVLVLVVAQMARI